MNYKMKLSDLKQQDGLYYIADIADVDGSPWVSKNEAKQILDEINMFVDVPVVDDFEDLFDDKSF